MHGNLFYGCATALVTPFRGGRVDYDALEALIDWQIDREQLCGGVNGNLLQEGLCHNQVCCSEPLSLFQSTADPYLHRRCSNIVLSHHSRSSATQP